MTDQSDQPQLAGLLRRIVEECPDPARLIELYYWSAENELADVMRQFVGLPAEVRATLHAFLMLVRDEPSSGDGPDCFKRGHDPLRPGGRDSGRKDNGSRLAASIFALTHSER